MVDKRKKRYQRIMLKLSGEALVGDKNYGICSQIIKKIGHDIKSILKSKTQIGIVIGGGNFFRGARLNGCEVSRITGDYLGMVATLMNALAICDIFTSLKIPAKAMSALPVNGLVERYDCHIANKYLNQGFVVIFAGGIGTPFVTTDTALCMRGIELQADLLLKATNVNGVYTADPKKNPRAKLYSHLTYDEALAKKLAVMDSFAFSLGAEHKMKLRIFNLRKKGALLRIVQGANEGTLVT